MKKYPNPSVKQLRVAFNDHRVCYVEYNSARTRHRGNRTTPWPALLRAVTVHHTAGKNSLHYLANENGWLPFCNNIISNGRYNDTDGVATIYAWGAVWHSGDGGPWPTVAARNSLHLVSWGIEIESLGNKQDITDKQIETTSRIIAALRDIGIPRQHVHRHADWTDGTAGVGVDAAAHGVPTPFPTKGRKIDTNVRWYPTDFWKDHSDKYLAK